MKGVRFGNYHSYDDFSLILSQKTIGTPSSKTEVIDIPGGDDFISSGAVTHGNRSGKVHFSNGLLIQWGNVTITPVANTPTSKAVTFDVSYTSAPVVLTIAYTTVPGTSVLGDAAANITTTGFDAYVTRTGTTNSGVMWVAIGYKA